MSERTECPYCSVGIGEPCFTDSGRPARNGHSARWAAYRSRLRNDESVVRIKTTDERLGVTEGELYSAMPYWLDTGKVTLLNRIPDGYDPECNQYGRDIEWVRWATPEDMHP